MKKIFVFLVAIMLSVNAFSFGISVPITESIVNSQITSQFPKTIKNIEFYQPKIVFLDNQSILCIKGIPRIMFLDKEFKFCATFTPLWNEKLSRLEATHLQLTNLDIDGIGSVSDSNKILLNELMIGLEPLVLYKSESWFFKQVTSIKVEKSTMYLNF